MAICLPLHNDRFNCLQQHSLTFLVYILVELLDVFLYLQGVVSGQDTFSPVTKTSRYRCSYTAILETHSLSSGDLHLTNVVTS